jgi:prostaglandin reductase 1
MPGEQVATVLKSKHPGFPEGTKVVGYFGWRDMTIFKPGTAAEQRTGTVYKLPDLKGLPDSYGLGVCGMPGNTAYFCVTRNLEPKAGETLVVTAAAGAVGSLVGQIGKLLGATVVGFAGSEEKVAWLKKLGFDQAYNYKSVDVGETYRTNLPQGIDCYFENVGGDFTYYALQSMNNGGRIAVVGAIANYNEPDFASKPYSVLFDYGAVIHKYLRIQGFLVYNHADEWVDGINQLRDWILEGKLEVQETISEGFESMAQAFIDVLNGKNIGKAVVRA